jgi:hypothetical protein
MCFKNVDEKIVAKTEKKNQIAVEVSHSLQNKTYKSESLIYITIKLFLEKSSEVAAPISFYQLHKIQEIHISK